MISAENLSYRYRRGVPVLQDLSFTIDSFPCVLLGPNGAGKSTLIQAVAGGIRPTSGSVFIGESGSRGRQGQRALRANTGWLPQDVPVVAGMNCTEQIAYAGWLKGMKLRDARQSAAGLLGRVGLGDYARRPVKELSGGQRRRLGIAQALVTRPSVVLFDEPYAGLDPDQRWLVRDTLVELSADTDLLVSTHQTDDVQDVYRSAVVLNHGRILFNGSIADFFGHAPEEAPPSMKAEAAYRAVLGGRSAPAAR